jgi:hypothetical protein
MDTGPFVSGGDVIAGAPLCQTKVGKGIETGG